MMYSSKQIGAGTFLGGPLAAIYFLMKNFEAQGDTNAARTTLATGTILTIGLILTLPFLPENFPNIVIPVGYTALASSLAQQQFAKGRADQFYSSWKVTGITVLSLIAFTVLALSVIFGFASMGLIDPD